MSSTLAWLLAVSVAQAALLVAAVLWLNFRVNRPVTRGQLILWLTPLVALAVTQWWLSFHV